MNVFISALALPAFLLLAPAAQAAGPDQLSKVNEIFVSVDDGVEDGCLPSPKLLKAEAELMLQRSGFGNFRSGFRLSGSPDHGRHELLITAVGGKLRPLTGHPHDGACVASLRIRIGRFGLLEDGTSAYILSRQVLTHYSGAKAGFQTQLREYVNEMVAGLAGEILKARTPDPHQQKVF